MGKTYSEILNGDWSQYYEDDYTGHDIVEAISDKPLSGVAATNMNLIRQAYKRATALMNTNAVNAVEVLLDVMRNGQRDQDRLKAAIKILEYTHGKPVEQDKIDNGKIEDLTDEEFEVIVESHSEEELQGMIERKYKREQNKD